MTSINGKRSISFVKSMPIKTTMRCLNTPTRIANIKNREYKFLMRIRSNKNFHSLLVGMQNGTATFQDSLIASYKAKDSLTIQSRSHLPRYLPN